MEEIPRGRMNEVSSVIQDSVCDCYCFAHCSFWSPLQVFFQGQSAATEAAAELTKLVALAGSSTVDVDITEREIVKFSVGTSGTSTFLGNVSHSASDSLFGSLSDPKSLLSLSSWSSQIDNSSGWHSKGPPLDKKKVQLDKCDNLLYF